MKVVVGFLVGVLLTVLAFWALSDKDTKHQLESAGDKIQEGVREATEDIDTGEIKEELREAGQAVKEASADAMISATIKTKFAADDTVPALQIDVDTTDGLVTLSGKVQSQTQIEEAVRIARSVDGVKEVVSTLQIARN